MPDNPTKNEYFIGVDLGGTKILAGVYLPTIECFGIAKISTKSDRSPEVVIDRIARCVMDAVDEADLNLKQVKAMGIGVPGAVNADSGTVVFAPNLGWRNIPLKKTLEKQFEFPVYIENDCNIALMGVYAAELKSKPRHVLGIFIGTGIGGGIIINGELYSGFSHAAGEVGHMIIDCNGPKCKCGNNGCFEAIASRTGIFQQIIQSIKNGQTTCLTEMLGNDLTGMRSGDLRKALRRNDKLVQKVIEQAAESTGIAVSNLANILNPEIIILGGGIIEALADDMLPIINQVARKCAMPGVLENIQIIASKLGDNAGIIGGTVLAKTMVK